MGVGAVHRTRLTGSRGDAHVSHWLKPTGIKSVQSFTINLTGATTATATIAAVNIAYSFVVFLGATSQTATAVNRDLGRVALTNSTTVTATQDASHNADPIVSGMVIEMWPGTVNSIQQGVVTINTNTTSGTASINPVNVNRTWLIYEGWDGTVADATPHSQATNFLQLTNSTTVTLTLGAGAGGGFTVNCGFTAVEFY